MKVKALKLFGDGKRLYSEGDIVNMTKEEYELLNSTPHAPLLEAVEEIASGSSKKVKKAKELV